MKKSTPKYLHNYNGKTVEFEIKEQTLSIKFSSNKKDTDRLSLLNFNKTYIEKLEQTDELNFYYNVKFNRKINKKTFKKIMKDDQVDIVKRIYTYKNKDYYGSASIIILTNTTISDEDVEIETKGKVFDRISDFILIQYRNEFDAYKHQRRLFNNKPNWIKHVELNLHTYDLRLPKDPIIHNSKVSNPILPYQKAYHITKTFETHHYKIKGSKKIKIAVFDTGIDSDHPDLIKSKTPDLGYDYLDLNEIVIPFGYNPHGTNCAGLIAATKCRTNGIDGVGRGCKLVDYRIGHSHNNGELKLDLFRLIKAFYRAGFQDKVDVINCSWGFNTGFSTLQEIIVKVANEGRSNKGIAIVFAAGNNQKPVCFPADMVEVITVSAINNRKEPKIKETTNDWGSNYGDSVDISAPGTNLVTTDIRGEYGHEKHDYYTSFGGTSGAAPQVAGCIGLMLSINPKLKIKQIKSIIKNHTQPFSITPDKNYGTGILDVYKTITEVKKLI